MKNGPAHVFPVGKIARATINQSTDDGELYIPARVRLLSVFRGWITFLESAGCEVRRGISHAG